jgi:hypothetical protein
MVGGKDVSLTRGQVLQTLHFDGDMGQAQQAPGPAAGGALHQSALSVDGRHQEDNQGGK